MVKPTKNKAPFLLNVLGMGIAFVTFYMIMSQVAYDTTFNRCIPDADKKFMMFTSWSEDNVTSNVSVQTSFKTAESIPGAKIGFMKLYCHYDKVYVGKGGDAKAYRFNVCHFTKSGAEILGANFTSGTFPEAEGDVAVSEKAARTMGISIGDYIYAEKDSLSTVTGIFKDYAENSDMDGCDILMNKEKEIMATADNIFSYNGIVSFANPDDKEKFTGLFRRNYRALLLAAEKEAEERGYALGEGFAEQQVPECRLIALSDIHFSEPDEVSDKPKASRSSVLVMLGIAFVIVTIAFINFVNYFIALVPEKMRAANIRKVFGASRLTLVCGFVKEALVYVGAAIVLACVLALFFANSPVSNLTDGSVGIADNIPALAVLIAVSVIFAVLSALFPAAYVTRTDAAVGVRGGFSRSRAGRVLRKTLITVQLTAATAMMIVSAVFHMQYRHMTGKDMGFDKENLYAMEIPCYKPELKSAVEGIPGVKAVTASTDEMTGSPAITMLGNPAVTHKKDGDGFAVNLNVRRVLPNYLDVMGIKMVSGSGFTETNTKTIIADANLLQQAKEDEVEEKVRAAFSYDLTGLCAVTDTKPVTDMTAGYVDAYTNEGSDFPFYDVLIYRTEAGADGKEVAARVKATVREVLNLDEESDVRTVDDELAARYARFNTQSLVVGLFSVVAVAIALMGVFGIVLFETEHRRHEVAVRKVLGAEIGDIVRMFCRQYACTVATACLIAAPVAVCVTRRWLGQFSSRTDVPAWVYLVSFAVVSVLTLAIIAVRTAAVAKENPVDNLKTE